MYDEENAEAEKILDDIEEFRKKTQKNKELLLQCMLIVELKKLNTNIINLDNTIYKKEVNK